MDCRQCHADLDRPGDYCLVCHTANCDAVVVDFDREAASLTMLDGEQILGETTITTVPETDDDHGEAGRLAVEVDDDGVAVGSVTDQTVVARSVEVGVTLPAVHTDSLAVEP